MSRAYTLRNIPGDLHIGWKAGAALKGISMRRYCFAALQRQIRDDLQIIARKKRKENARSSKDESRGN